MSSKIVSLMKTRFFAIVTILAFVGVLGLYIYAIIIEPEELTIGEIDSDDVGLTITTRGVVKEIAFGSALHFTLIDSEKADSIPVYMPLNAYEELSFKSYLLPGAKVKVKADVSNYNGKLELYVRTSKSLDLLSKPENPEIELEILARNPELFRDLNITVEGQVISIENFYDLKRSVGTILVLKSGKYGLECVAYGIDLKNEISVGAMTTLTGTFEYKESDLSWILVIDIERMHSA